MDRKLTASEKNRSRSRRLAIAGVAVAAIAVVWTVARWAMTPEVDIASLRTATAANMPFELTVQASAKVVPAFEQIITSPISTRIVEVYATAGDTVDEGTPLLLLDRTAASVTLNEAEGTLVMKQLDRHQLELTSETELTQLAMQIESKEMATARLATDLENERRLDSIGSGTGNRVRDAELQLRTSQLELAQMKRTLENKRNLIASQLRAKDIDAASFSKNLGEIRRAYDDAIIKSPHRATLTYIATDLGRQIAAGEHVATIADIDHFRLTCAVGEAQGPKLVAGATVRTRTGSSFTEGRIVGINPLSVNGSIEFSVQLSDSAAMGRLRPGMSAEAFVVTDVRPDAIVLPKGPYYRGNGDNTVFVVNRSKGRLERREVTLGDVNHTYVEVKGGLAPGEEVVISDLSSRFGSKSINIK